MKIGILVDGQAEFHGLRLLLPRLNTDAEILSPLYCDVQPFASPAQIAHVAVKRIPILTSKGACEVVVLIDKETRPDCTPHIASEIERELNKRLPSATPDVSARVVVKVRSFENWLVADPRAFSELRGMFRYRNRIQRAVTPDKADNVNALDLLKRCCRVGHFDKVRGATAICANLNPERAAKNSRSFRRFLRLLRHPSYSKQSREP